MSHKWSATSRVRCGALILLLALGGCGKGEDRKGSAAEGDSMTARQIIDDALVAKPEWIRKEPIDLRAIDRDGDGELWQCPVDGNVVADEVGVCPNCNRKLERVDFDKASSRMEEQEIEVAR